MKGGEGTTDKVKEEKERINNNNKNKRELVKNQKEEEKKEMKGGKFKKWVERMNKTHETKKKKSPSSLFHLLPPPIPLSSSPSRLPLGLSRHADNDDLDSGLQNRRITTGI